MPQPGRHIWQQRLYKVVYESDTPAGKAFDIALLLAILASITVVMLDSVDVHHLRRGRQFFILEWTFTTLFSLEFIARLICIRKPLQYVFSPLGLIDLLAIIPSYLSIAYAGAQSLLAFRALRLLRVFRIFKLTRFLTEVQFLTTALQSSLRKISIFMLTVLMIVVILGSVMYLVEKRENGFSNIPESIYWAIVTVTTVGYGDISPVTPLGKAVASLIMLLGYGIIAVPTGILTTEMNSAAKKARGSKTCGCCGERELDADARYCMRCGAAIADGSNSTS